MELTFDPIYASLKGENAALRASHGQAPAQEAPAAVAVPVMTRHRTKDDILHFLTKEQMVEEIIRLDAALAAAPTTQPAPMESVLIDGIAYQAPAPVAAELLRLHIDAHQAAHSVELGALQSEIAGHEAANLHLSAMVDELRELLQDAKRAMTELHQAAIPDESAEGVPAIIPPDAFRAFVDAHAKLCFCLHQRGHNPVQDAQQPAHQQEPASVDLKTMELAESVGLIGPASRTHDLHAAIQRFHDLICANATIKAAQMAAEVISKAAPQQEAAEDVDGHAFRTAARLGLTLRFYGGCAQSGMPGSPSAYEVCADRDRAAAMREAVARAEAVISRGGEAQRLEAPQQERVHLVATGETLNGRELYERHEKYVPLADCETLYTAPQPLPASQGDALSQAARDVLAERQRQIEVEGWTPEHDDKEHLPNELALAAASYVCADEGEAPPAIWPWDWSWWKPRDRRRNLVKSGALILAELERMDRADAARAAQEGKSHD